MHPLPALARRFVIDWLDRADADVPPQIMVPGYQVHIGDVELDGLAAYVPATVGQLEQFPGLQLTVHDLVHTGDRLAMHFTEHGASLRHDLRGAAWTGVALFRWDGDRLTENWTQEDYAARRRQLADGQPDIVGAPMVAPWTVPPAAPDPAAEEVVRAWLATAVPGTDGVRWDDGRDGPLIAPADVQVAELFSAGGQVAFAATQLGASLGVGTLSAAVAEGPVRLGLAGLVSVADGCITNGVVVSDRLGLLRSQNRRGRTP
jgi:predicted ester cyclase